MKADLLLLAPSTRMTDTCIKNLLMNCSKSASKYEEGKCKYRDFNWTDGQIREFDLNDESNNEGQWEKG